MTAKDHFLELMAERRRYQRGTAEHNWRTRAARKFVWIMRGVPSKDWTE